MKLPEIRIQYAWLIDPVFRAAFLADRKHKTKRYPTPEQIRRKVRRYRKQWSPHEHKILQGICRATGVGFQENIIHVHVIGRARRSVSYPLVTYATSTPDEFVDVLTHELIHHILSENTKRVNFFPVIGPLTRGKSSAVKVHVLVHAIHQHIYLDVLKDPSRLRRDVEWSQKHPVYKTAWDIVEEYGYTDVLTALRETARKKQKRARDVSASSDQSSAIH